MPTILATIALVVSIISLGFGIYQYQVFDRIRLGEKPNNLLHAGFALQRRSDELKHKIGCTDNAPDYEHLYSKINQIVEAISAMISSHKEVSWKDLNSMEALFLSLEQETDLLYQQVSELARFNEEVREYEKSQRKA